MTRIPLWDGDVLLYQVGFAAESSWRMQHAEKGIEIDLTENPPPFSVAEEIVMNRISNTHALVDADQPPILFFTGNTNFRNEISTTGYKLRRGGKPYHYYNLKAFLKSEFEWEEVEGLEADDLLAIFLTKLGDKSICIGADKDLLQVSGWHYLYEYGKVAAFGPHKVEGYGEIRLDSNKKLRGWGMKFFYAQCIMGDPVDSIIGIPKSGPIKAYSVLKDTYDEATGFQAVKQLYLHHYGEDARDKLLENGRMLFMIRELDNQGKPVLWDFPKGWDG
jgi:5'-3' exonuclease